MANEDGGYEQSERNPYVSVLPIHYDPEVEGEPESDEIALVRAAQVEPAAFAEVYRRYLARVYRYLRTRTDSEEDAADLTQQVFLQALIALPKYRERGIPFAAWLFRIARNVATDAHRRRKDTLDWHLVAGTRQSPREQEPEAIVLQREALNRLHELLDGVDPAKRELIALRFAAGLTAYEIAAVIGKSEAAVHKQLARTLHALKEQYKEQYNEE